MERIGKIKNILALIKYKSQKGEFIILPHAIDRQMQRNISAPDIVKVLTTGWHESKKDEYKEEYHVWNYAIRGKTIDNRELRIAVSFDENDMLIVTVIHLKE
ncbi:MAG: DUF4258 domain-containing protein [Oligoflexia bacterium]|nr:DUF4258 domain-containing protein [Oligoflexia bacterium]